MKNRRIWIIAICAAALAAAGWAASYFRQIHGTGPDPSKMNSEQILAFVQSQDFNSLPHQQKREFFEKVVDIRVQGYFNTPAENRQEYLDKVIDDMQKFRQDNLHRRDPNRLHRGQQGFANRTGEDRRFRREMRDPVKDAMRREFFSALRARAESRGIQGRRPF